LRYCSATIRAKEAIENRGELFQMESTEKKDYKSPRRKLVRFFEKSRDNWKRKYTELKKKMPYLENRIRYLKKSRWSWKEQAEAAKEELRKAKESLKITEEKLKEYETKEEQKRER